jgi:hypothetical protein
MNNEDNTPTTVADTEKHPMKAWLAVVLVIVLFVTTRGAYYGDGGIGQVFMLIGVIGSSFMLGIGCIMFYVYHKLRGLGISYDAIREAFR